MRVLVCSNSLVIVSLVVVSRHNHNVPTVGDTIVCRRQIFGYLSSHKSGVHSTLEPRLQDFKIKRPPQFLSTLALVTVVL